MRRRHRYLVREASQLPDHLVAEIRGGERVFGLARLERPLRGERESSEPGAGPVERGPVQVRHRIIDAAPTFPRCGGRRLA